MASIKRIDLSEVAALLDGSSGPLTTKINFYDVFGSDGCELGCEERKKVQQLIYRRMLRSQKKNTNEKPMLPTETTAKDDALRYFTRRQWETSANLGCESCKVLSILLYAIFTQNVEQSADGTESSEPRYSISTSFLMCEERTVDSAKIVNKIQLFGLKESVFQLDGLPPSHFLSGATSSTFAFERLSRWLEVCNASHPNCLVRQEPLLPTRLIDVSSVEVNQKRGVRLVQTIPSQTGTYTALSHCWGKTPIKAYTTTKTLKAFQDFIDWELIPKNFRDAITITRVLGIQFLWIDSLCIVQDDLQDWEIESSKMSEVYENAYLTIAAAWSADSTGGCFSHTNADICFSCGEVQGRPLLIGARMCDTRGVIRDSTEIQKRYALFQRAWVFQERLMSSRVIYYHYGEIAFQCRETLVCECGNQSIPPHYHRGGRDYQNTGVKQFHQFKDSAIRWRTMVKGYMALNLTYPTDIMPAISGCAKQTAALTKDEYVAGLWRKSLTADLLWVVFAKKNGVPKPRHDQWTAPTWSWASVPVGQLIDFAAHHVGITDIFGPQILEIHYERAGKNKLGALKSASMRVNTCLFPCFIRRYCRLSQRRFHSGWRYDIHRSYESSSNACKVENMGLDTYGDMQFNPDVPLVNEELNFTLSRHCIDQGETYFHCATAPAYLLHLARMVRRTNVNDYFMVLREQDPQCSEFVRIGLTSINFVSSGQANKWFEEVWKTQLLPEKDITLL